MFQSDERSCREKVFFESEHKNICSITVNSTGSQIYSLNYKIMT